jgi:hypothetical protein
MIQASCVKYCRTRQILTFLSKTEDGIFSGLDSTSSFSMSLPFLAALAEGASTSQLRIAEKITTSSPQASHQIPQHTSLLLRSV